LIISDNKPSAFWSFLSFIVKGVLLLLVLACLAPFILNSQLAWPIEERIERNHIYSACRARIAAAGGWEAVDQACLSYATNGFNPGGNAGLYYFGGRLVTTNPLPKTIDLLRPEFVEMATDQNGVPVLQLVLSAGHRTGTYDTPYYAIWVICTNRPNYVPVFGSQFRGAHGSIEQKGSAIFEAR
jgi:hypothetical protein